MGLVVLVTTAVVVAVSPAQQRGSTLSQLHHTSWTVRDGAPAGIETIAQSADGFIWLATGTGLYRFDGVRFELFEPPPGQHLPSSNISEIFAPPGGGLWLGYRFGGVSLIRGDTIVSYPAGEQFPRGSVFAILEDSAGTTWASTTTGLARLQGDRWHRVTPDEGFPDGGVSDLLMDSRRRLWVSGEAGVFVRAHGSDRFQRMAPSLHTSGSRIYSFLAEAPDGAILGSSQDGGLVQVAPSDSGRGPVLPRIRESSAMLIDRTGALWLVRPGAGGIDRFWLYPARGVASDSVVQRMYTGLSANIVTGLLQDREGNVWLSTAGGLERFRQAKLTRLELPRLQENIALAAGDSGSLWVGSAGRSMLHVGDAIREFPEVVRPVEMAYRAPDGVIWVGSPFGLWRFDRDRFTRVRLPDVKNIGVQAATIDGAGNLWISIARSGVYRRVGERWIPFGDVAGLPREPAIVLTTDDSARTWFGYTGGRVGLLEADSARLFTEEQGVNVGNVLAIHVRQGNVWVGGEFGLVTLVGDRFRPVIDRHGTSFGGVSGIVETPEGEVWLHGARGIVRLSAGDMRRVREDSTWRVESERLDFRDGLEGAAQQIRPQPTVIAGTDGRLWFATTVNIAWLDPRAVPRNPVPPPVVIQRLTADDRDYPVRPDLRLPVNTSALRIDYTALSLSIPERVRFRYQLVGSDTAWQDAGGRREAFYTNLRPGSYRFRVIAANDDGVWNESGAELGFTIPPAFTQTRWFLAVWVVALAALAWLLYLVRMRQISGRLQLGYQAALAERSRIAQELHDTLLQEFTGITLQLRAIERKQDPQGSDTSRALKSVLTSADTALRDARHMIWDIRAMDLEGRDLPEALEVAARHAIAGSPADLGFKVEGEHRRLSLDAETSALRICREAVLNAVKHAAPETISVVLTYSAEELMLRVSDDGAGIPPGALEAAASGEHLGIAGIRARVQRARGRLAIESEEGRGTTVSVSLPIVRT